MSPLQIDLACGDYDIVRPLHDGTIRAEGMEINFVTINKPPEVHWRMGINQEFDAAEMSLCTFVAGNRHSRFRVSQVSTLVRLRQRQSCDR
jgi:4,5-dihydroxyphthalate decarboxylase